MFGFEKLLTIPPITSVDIKVTSELIETGGGSGKGIPCRHLFLPFSLPILELIEDWGHVKQFFQKPLDFKEGGSVGKQLGQRLVEFGSRTF